MFSWRICLCFVLFRLFLKCCWNVFFNISVSKRQRSFDLCRVFIIFRNLNRSLNRRRMSPGCTNNIASYFGHDNSARLTWSGFYRCSSSCISGLISPRREVLNMLFIWRNFWPIPKPLRKITCFEGQSWITTAHAWGDNEQSNNENKYGGAFVSASDRVFSLRKGSFSVTNFRGKLSCFITDASLSLILLEGWSSCWWQWKPVWKVSESEKSVRNLGIWHHSIRLGILVTH